MEATFPRKIEERIKVHLASEQAIVVTGMRRVGKTTLLRRIFDGLETDNKRWSDFENPLEIKKFEEIDYNHIVDNLGLNKEKQMFMAIDEIQNFPEISKIMKYLIDHYRVKFLVTGSASYYLKNLFPESLAGRKQILELYPLDFCEFLLFKGIKYQPPETFADKARQGSIFEYEKNASFFHEYLEYGGFPEVVLEKNAELKIARLKEIFSSYYEKEVLGLSGFKRNKEVRDLIILLAGRVGSKLDITKISQELGISRVTINNYLHFLERTYLVFLISPFTRSVDREISGRPKLYFGDTGLTKIIANLNSGQTLENSVFNLLKFYGKINYYQKRRSEKEIDFILNESVGFEVKEKATVSHFKELAKLAKDLKLKEAYLISRRFAEGLDNVIFPQLL